MKLDRIIAVRNNKTVYRDGSLCIKVFSRDFSKADILNEALNCARIEETGLNVPKLREITAIDGKWAIVSDYANGKSLSALIKEYPSKKGEYLSFFAELQQKIYQKECPLLSRQSDKIRMKIEASELSDNTKELLKARLAEMPEHSKLCHGDFTPSNVIVDEEESSFCIIDWSHASVGNSSADAAWSYLSFLLCGDPDGAEQYLELFCTLSKTDKAYVKKWLPLAAAEKLAAANERERRFLHAQINLK